VIRFVLVVLLDDHGFIPRFMFFDDGGFVVTVVVVVAVDMNSRADWANMNANSRILRAGGNR
jgi:hypothetical protein